MTLVFAASPGMVFLAHEIGYLDYVGLIAVPLFITWAARTRIRGGFLRRVVISVVLALIHESMVIMFAPTMLLAMVCHIVRKPRASARAGARSGGWPRTRSQAAVVALGGDSSLVGTLGTKTAGADSRAAGFHRARGQFPAAQRWLRRVVPAGARQPVTRLMPWFWTFPINRRYLTRGWWWRSPG